ncbi:MAG: ROK family protein [Clostridia bacterium]|nr:ROK family protein [Clostridia bacterium]
MEIRSKTSQQMIKDANLKLVFSLISQHEPISRADLKKITGLSATTVSALCEELFAENLILETGMKESTKSGRKAVLLSINPEGGYFGGIKIGSALRLDLYDLKFRRVKSAHCPITNWKNLSSLIAKTVEEATNVLERQAPLLGLTIGVPAAIDTQNSKILSSTVLEELTSDEDIVGELRKIFPNIPILLCNDSSLIAYAEKEFGDHARNLISIDISDGVGSGIVIDGNIYAGASGMAGEFGHISVDLNGPKCKCGSFGCLESMVSIPAILNEIKKETSLILTPEEAYAACSGGNDRVKAVLEKVAKVLSFGIGNVLNLLDPELIVLSGEIKEFGDALLLPLRQHLAEKTLLGKDIPVQFSSVEGNAVTLGGARYAFDIRFQ